MSQLFTLVSRSLQTSPFATLCMVSQVKQVQLIVVEELDENSHNTENTYSTIVSLLPLRLPELFTPSKSLKISPFCLAVQDHALFKLEMVTYFPS